jgi:hypothetical protein
MIALLYRPRLRLAAAAPRPVFVNSDRLLISNGRNLHKRIASGAAFRGEVETQ